MKRARWAVGRITWGAMLVAHSAWFLRSLGSPGTSPDTQFALFVAIVFFALKAWDVPFLRCRWNRRSLVAAGMVVVLLHTGAINRSMGDGTDAPPWWLPVAATSPFWAVLARRRLMGRLAESLAVLYGRIQATLMHARWPAFIRARHHRHQQFSVVVLTPRAPPASFSPDL